MKSITYYLVYLKNLIKHGLIDFFTEKKRFKQFTSFVNSYDISSELNLRSTELKSIELNELLNDIDYDNLIKFKNWKFSKGNVSLYELFCLSSIVKYLNAKKILEIGTFNGLTTLQMAINTSPETEIHTMDLPQTLLTDAEFALAPGDRELVEKKGFEIGQYYKSSPYSQKVIQHFCDSAKFDYSKWQKCFDFVFIDGAHSYEYVKCDTENSLNILKENGSIIWHDYGNVKDVIVYLNELSKKINLHRIKDTSLVIFSPALFKTESNG